MIVVDVECTGLNPDRHSILSIGAIDYNSPIRTFYGECRAFPGAELSEEGLKIAGFSHTDIVAQNKPTLEALVAQFLIWSGDCTERTLAGHNPDFDRDFLRASAERYNLPWTFGHRVVDLHSLAYGYQFSRGILPSRNELSGLTSDQIHSFVGLPEEPHPHHALTGAAMEAEAFSRLLFGQHLLKQFRAYPIPKHLRRKAISKIVRKSQSDASLMAF